MRILGIDPGTSLIGYGIIDTEESPPAGGYTSVDFGVLRTQSNIANADRVKTVYDFFKKLIKKYQPDVLSIESLFFFKNIKTVLKVSEIRGILLLAAADQGLEIKEFTPLQVKQAVSSYGRADKQQVQRMVELILNIKINPDAPIKKEGSGPRLKRRGITKNVPDDAVDALAIAICCALTLRH